MTANRPNRRKYLAAPLRFDVILRVAMLSNASITVALAGLVPTSLTSILLQQGGPQGGAVSTLMLVIVFVAWCDLIINDFASAKYTFACAKTRRHLVYSLLGAVYFLQAFASVGETLDSTDVLSLGYVAAGLVCAWYSLAVAVKGSYD